MTEGFIPPHGGYQKLLSYQRAEIVYDATVRFCARFLDRRDRTVDQILERLETSHYRRAEIGDRLDRIGDPRPGVGLRGDGLPDIIWRRVPGGQVELEGYAGSLKVESFEIAQYPATYRQYRTFLESSEGYCDRRWWQNLKQRQEPGEQYRLFGNCPADTVSWYDAMAFCRWLSDRLGEEIRLPTEWEWQQAATGGDPRNTYPWGPEWKSGHANTWESKLGRTTAVGMYPAGASAHKVMDLAGNVWEWCLNKYENRTDTTVGGNDRRVLRGGSWSPYLDFARTAFRDDGNLQPDFRDGNLGFRVVRGSPSNRLRRRLNRYLKDRIMIEAQLL